MTVPKKSVRRLFATTLLMLFVVFINAQGGKIKPNSGSSTVHSLFTLIQDPLTNSEIQKSYDNDESSFTKLTSSTITFDQLGTYNYYVRATNGDCDVIKRIKVYVYNDSTCDYRYERKMASSESVDTVSLLGIPLGGSYYSVNAVDSDLSTFSQIYNGVSLLGIGTTWQDLKFDAPFPAGTPVTVKLGQGYSLTQVIGGITMRPLDASGNAIGRLMDVGEMDLLNLLVGDNVFEVTFIPTDSNGNPIDYSGVRVHWGSVLGLVNTMFIYGAYVEFRNIAGSGSQECNNIVINGATIPDKVTDPPSGKVVLNSVTEDITWGVEDTGLGAATSLSGVIHPYLAVDSYYEYEEVVKPKL